MGSVMELLGSLTQSIEINATVYPVCECGKPWATHGECGGYKPSRPIESVGTVAFASKDPIANFLWKLEKFIQKIRRKRQCRSQQTQ